MKLPVVTVAIDIIVLTIADARLQMALIEWGIPPYEGRQALPDSFVLSGESVMDMARHELVEETGLGLNATHLGQLATFGESGRNPRDRMASATHLVLAASLGGLTPGSDASGTRWCPVDDLLSLVSDHDGIPRTGIERARVKLEYMTAATWFCGPRSTMTELRQVYGTAWGVEIDPRNFSRKVLGSQGFVVECGTRSGGHGRPVALYRARTADSLHPPVMWEG